MRIDLHRNLPVADLDAPGRDGRDFRIMRHQHNGPAFAAQLAEEREDGLAGGGVEVAGGFVRKDDFRAVDQRARDGGPLLLAA